MWRFPSAALSENTTCEWMQGGAGAWDSVTTHVQTETIKDPSTQQTPVCVCVCLENLPFDLRHEQQNKYT